jgi:hypothetical protein
MAAKLKQAGYKPILGERPDLACDVDDRRLHIECKRPASDNAVRKRLKEAGGQLEVQMKNWKTLAGTRGVIAVSLSRVLNPGDKFLRYKREDEAREFLGDSLEKIQQECDGAVKALPTKIIGVLWHVITPAVDETLNMFIIAQHMLVQGINKTSPQDDAPVKKLYENLKQAFGWS